MPVTSRSRGVRVATDGQLTLDEIGRWLDDCMRAGVPRDARPSFAPSPHGGELAVRWDFAADDPAAAGPADPKPDPKPDPQRGHAPDMTPATRLRRGVVPVSDIRKP